VAAELGKRGTLASASGAHSRWLCMVTLSKNLEKLAQPRAGVGDREDLHDMVEDLLIRAVGRRPNARRETGEERLGLRRCAEVVHQRHALAQVVMTLVGVGGPLSVVCHVETDRNLGDEDLAVSA